MTKLIKLTGGHEAIVDDVCFDYLNQWRWQAYVGSAGEPKGPYAYRSVKAGGLPAYRVFMHRQILGVGHSEYLVDHISRNTLDNRMANLRLCTASQNSINAYKDKRRQKSPYRGVTQATPTRWVAQARFDGKLYRFGSRPSAEEAARLYDQEATKLQGEFAILNFPLGDT